MNEYEQIQSDELEMAVEEFNKALFFAINITGQKLAIENKLKGDLINTALVRALSVVISTFFKNNTQDALNILGLYIKRDSEKAAN